MVQGQPAVAFGVLCMTASQHKMAFRVGRVVRQGGGQMTAGFGELALFQGQLGQPKLRFLSDVRRQIAQTGKVAEAAQGPSVNPEGRVATTFVEKMFAKIERPAHDTASLLRPWRWVLFRGSQL